MFVGCLEGQQYILGNVDKGIAAAILNMTRLREEDRRAVMDQHLTPSNP